MDYVILRNTREVLEHAEIVSQRFAEPTSMSMISDLQIYNPARASSRKSVVQNVMMLCQTAKKSLLREIDGQK